jgi:predicted transcriptional regulator
MAKKPYRTDHQKALMGLLLKRTGEGVHMTVAELHRQLPYTASYGAMRKTLQGLTEQGMIFRERRGIYTYVSPTQRGYDWFRPT